MLAGDPVDHLRDQHRLADAGAAEQTDLATSDVRREQVDHLDAGFEHARRRLEGVERRGVTVDLPTFHVGELVGRLVGTEVERIAPHVPDVAEHLGPDGDGDSPTGVAHRRAPGQAVGRLHADRPHAALAELLGDLGEHDHDLALDFDLELQRRVQRRERTARKLDIDHRTGDPRRLDRRRQSTVVVVP